MAEETSKIVRIMRKDLPGELSVENALRSIRGINFMTARAIRIRAGIDKSKRMGDLSDAEIDGITKILESPHGFNFPHWILNRRKDPVSGIDTHLVESELMLTHREDLTTMKKTKTYRGLRHMFDLPVRGQRTKSTGRKNRTIGVTRKKGK